MNPLTYALINSAIVALIWTGAWQVERGALTQGQVVALVNYMSQILVELIKLANLIITITKAAGCARRIESVVDENSSMTFPGEPAQDDPTAQDAVVFENVALRYGGAGAESLSGLSFRVRRGQTVGIIGGTGSGKSSLVNLIPRFYDATGGRILVDGVDVRDYPAGQLRSKIGIVPQKAVLFAGTIAENLRWGKEDATDAELQIALETSQAAEFAAFRQSSVQTMLISPERMLSAAASMPSQASAMAIVGPSVPSAPMSMIRSQCSATSAIARFSVPLSTARYCSALIASLTEALMFSVSSRMVREASPSSAVVAPDLMPFLP